MDKAKLTQAIKAKAMELGFTGIAISKAEHMDEEARHLEAWLNQGYHGEMRYLEAHFDLKVDPRKLVKGSKSVISIMYNCYNDEMQHDPQAPKIASYAYGKDYHRIVKKKILQLYRWMEEVIGQFHGRCFVDSAPILERDWAKRSGLGWIGKNTLLIHPKKGSYFFLCEIICDLELEYDHAIEDHCGTCTRCIEACPTEAIAESGYVVDGSKCISYLTIELRGDIPAEFKGKMQNYVFGCDICQQVCPWNRFATKHQEPKFEPLPGIMEMTKKEWEELTEESFNIIFHGSAIKRAAYDGLMRNVKYLYEEERGMRDER